MASRVISAIVGIPLVMGAVLAGLPWLSLLVAVLASLGALEFYRMAKRRGVRPAVLLGIAWALAFIVSGHLNGWPIPWVILGGIVVTLLWHQASRFVSLPLLVKNASVSKGFNDSLADWAYTAAGAVYMGWTLSLFLVLRTEPKGLEWLLVILLGTFATDTGAFFIGKTLGRKALAPQVSPGKTWEGAVGGFIFGAGTVLALTPWLELPISIWEGAALGALVGVSAQVGDLVESITKRAAGVKDSGKLIPGHGGILDRLDSVVFVVVVVYHFFIWVVK